MKSLSRPALTLLGFFLVALAWRAAFLPATAGAYTDGILQVDCFRYGMTYWPPLYALMARLTAWVPGVGLLGGGRLASLLAGALVVLPIGVIGRRLFGRRAAFWAMAVWVVSPMALRWSLQVMTDMPMLALWTGALGALTVAMELHLPGLFATREGETPPPPDFARGGQWLTLATMLATLATLTRYQGGLLLPLTVLAAWRLGRVRRAGGASAVGPWLAQFIWLAVPIWTLHGGLGPLRNHFEQIGAREGSQGFWFALIEVYWNFFESFLALSPYFVTWGVFGFLLFGLFRTNWATARVRWAGWAALYLALAVLVAQSVFSSFQERYLLPLLPLVCLFAGHGLAVWERRCSGRPLRFWGLAAPALTYALVFGALVGVWQGTPFVDIEQAATFIRDEVKPGIEQRIVTNEFYNDKIGAVKVNYWSGDQPTVQFGTTRLKAGDLLIISSFYAGGLDRYYALLRDLSENPAVERLHAPWQYTEIPFFPDLMPPPYNQNPMAWNARYQPVRFETSIYRVRNLTQEALDRTPPPVAVPQGKRSGQLLNQLKSLENEIDALSTATQPRQP